MRTVEHVICEPHMAGRIAYMIASGKLPRLYKTRAEAVAARDRYPSFGTGRYFYCVYSVEVDIPEAAGGTTAASAAH